LTGRRCGERRLNGIEEVKVNIRRSHQKPYTTLSFAWKLTVIH